MAQVARPLQCSLAAADIALHVGTMDSSTAPDQAGLRNLIQVMGVLCTESALALIPRFDRQTQLYTTEKKSLREKVLEGVKPPSTSIALMKSSVFSEGLFPEKVFKEIDIKAREVDAQSFFPKLEAAKPSTSKPATRDNVPPSAFKRPREPSSPADNSQRKKTKPSLPAFPGRGQFNGRQVYSYTPKNFPPKGGQQGASSSSSGGKNLPKFPQRKKTANTPTIAENKGSQQSKQQPKGDKRK